MKKAKKGKKYAKIKSSVHWNPHEQLFLKKSNMEGFNGSRTIAPPLPTPNCPRGNLPPLPPTPKLTLTQTLTLTRGQFSTMAIVWLPPTLKLTLTLTQTPIPNRGAIFLGGNCPDTGFNIGRIEIAYNRYFDL